MEPGPVCSWDQTLGGVPQLTPMHQQLSLAQHLAANVLGQAGVDAGILLGHIPQHQGVGGAFLLLTEPLSIHQLDAVLEAQEAD